MSGVFRAVVHVSMIALSGAMALAQFESASLTGVVTDAAGAVVPGVTVNAVNEGTNLQATTTTNAEGRFADPADIGVAIVQPRKKVLRGNHLLAGLRHVTDGKHRGSPDFRGRIFQQRRHLLQQIERWLLGQAHGPNAVGGQAIAKVLSGELTANREVIGLPRVHRQQGGQLQRLRPHFRVRRARGLTQQPSRNRL